MGQRNIQYLIEIGIDEQFKQFLQPGIIVAGLKLAQCGNKLIRIIQQWDGNILWHLSHHCREPALWHCIIEETSSHCGNIPSCRVHVTCIPLHLFHALNLYFNANFCKLALEQRGNGTDGTVVSRASKDHMKRRSILFPDAGGLIHDPSCLIKKLISTIHVIGIILCTANI